MALTWDALATRDARLLSQAIERRHRLPEGTAWVNYVRGHDDIGWTFADEDAAEFGIDGYWHRRFLNQFFIGRHPGSFARGEAFQENPQTGDARVAGTTASLAGIEAGDAGGEDRVILAHAVAMSTGGIPLLYLGDEVAQLNDYSYLDRAAEAGDSRWVNRPARPVDAYASRHDESTAAGRVFTRLARLIAVRKETPEFSGNRLIAFHTPHPSVLAFQRPGPDGLILVLANFGDHRLLIDASTVSGFEDRCVDLISGTLLDLRDGVALPAHAIVWLRVTALS